MCCVIVGCVIYIWKWRCAWRGVQWNVGLMWNCVPRCGGVILNVVQCGMSVATSDIVWCEMWLKNAKCGMLHNARCGKSWCDVKCGVELWWWRMWHMQCAVWLLRDVGCGKWCNVLRCQMWWCDVKSRCAGVMWCGIWCGAWNSCGCGMVRDVDCGCVMWNMLCFEMWWCEMVVGYWLRCNVMWIMVWCEMCCDVECGCGVE